MAAETSYIDNTVFKFFFSYLTLSYPVLSFIKPEGVIFTSYAEDTFMQSTRMQIFLKTI